MSDVMPNNPSQQSTTHFVPTFLQQGYQFDYSNVGKNGLLLRNIYLPEETLLHILSCVDPKELLNCALVCQNWKRLIRSESLWFTIYEKRYKRKAKILPWYLYYCLLTTNYFDNNLLVNNDNVERSTGCYGDGPSEYLKKRYPGKITATDVFVLFITTTPLIRFRAWCKTNSWTFNKQWFINLRKSKLLQHILDVYKPHICLTKWGVHYRLSYGLLKNNGSECTVNKCCEPQSLGEYSLESDWLNITITQYPKGIEGILLQQIYDNDDDLQFVNMGSANLLFDSIQPADRPRLRDFNEISAFEFILEKEPVAHLLENN